MTLGSLRIETRPWLFESMCSEHRGPRNPILITISPCRVLKREPQLTQFETAQIANLCPQTADEAKGCIPRYSIDAPNPHSQSNTPWKYASHSLVKIDDDRLQALLDEVQALRRFQN